MNIEFVRDHLMIYWRKRGQTREWAHSWRTHTHGQWFNAIKTTKRQPTQSEGDWCVVRFTAIKLNRFTIFAACTYCGRRCSPERLSSILIYSEIILKWWHPPPTSWVPKHQIQIELFFFFWFRLESDRFLIVWRSLGGAGSTQSTRTNIPPTEFFEFLPNPTRICFFLSFHFVFHFWSVGRFGSTFFTIKSMRAMMWWLIVIRFKP